MKLLRNTLDVVKAIDANDELDTLKLTFKGSDAVLDFRLLQSFIELFRVDSNRERADCHNLALELDSIGSCDKPTNEMLAYL